MAFNVNVSISRAILYQARAEVNWIITAFEFELQVYMIYKSIMFIGRQLRLHSHKISFCPLLSLLDYDF